jgi:hypothetical protein
MKLLTALLALEHLTLCGPIFILSSKIGQRNYEIFNFFPPVLEEQISTKVSYALSIAFPLFYFVLPFIQYGLFLAYHKFGHPWSKILNTKTKKSLICEMD